LLTPLGDSRSPLWNLFDIEGALSQGQFHQCILLCTYKFKRDRRVAKRNGDSR
jgi:hypothetical protein